jgi:hypothetical protein
MGYRVSVDLKGIRDSERSRVRHKGKRLNVCRSERRNVEEQEVPKWEENLYILRRDGKSAKVIEKKADMRRPLRKRVRNSLKAKGLNETC